MGLLAYISIGIAFIPAIGSEALEVYWIQQDKAKFLHA
jgi:hypothetical protein